MKTVVIVASHFPPSNLTGGHRSRLIARHLPSFGWRPILVTVHHDYYEEALDWSLTELVPEGLRVERVAALPTRPLRIVGDVGIRGFVPMLRRILELVDRQTVDFLYITVPSFFAAPLGRAVHALRGVPYGIDYVDPWVHVWPGSERPLSKAWISRRLGDLLEPISVRRAALLTGVAEAYYKDVLVRNPRLTGQVVTAAMPYGGEVTDHERAREMQLRPYLFSPGDGAFHVLYAGSMLPRAVTTLGLMLEAIAADRGTFRDVRFHFVGTGKSPDDAQAFNVRPLAEQYGLWNSVVTEHPARIPYLDVLAHLEAADALLLLGSTEPHYTPSKVYQFVLAQRPVFAILHQASTACAVIRETNAGQVLEFDGEENLDTIRDRFASRFRSFRQFSETFDPSSVSQRFRAHTSYDSTRVLAEALDLALERAASSKGI